MQRQLLALAIGTLMTMPAHTDEQADQAVDALLRAAAAEAKAAIDGGEAGWLSRTDINVDIQQDHKPSWSIETIQPIYQSEGLTHTWFVQGRIAHSNDDQTVNLGTGYRHLLDDHSWLLGTNIWYDTTIDESHYRYGLGLEALGRYVDVRANWYDAQSGIKTVRVNGSVSETEAALDGWDFGLEAPVPYLPWARVSWKAYEWDRSTAENIQGNTLGIRANVTDNLEVTVGATDDNTDSAQAFVTLSWTIDRPQGREWTAADTGATRGAFVARDLTKHTLDKVRRHHDIVIEKKRTGGAGITVGRRN
ncbi:MAG: inverse autotransporter beta domain-containing protein [Gammaproteobacteria bacterium]|nr:inverse autotransporter beta domain-containing protein [Gammaproteobacteria bacterium]